MPQTLSRSPTLPLTAAANLILQRRLAR